MENGVRNVRDGVHFMNILPGFVGAILTLGYALTGLVLVKQRVARVGLVLVVVATAFLTFTHPLFEKWP